MEEGYEGGCKQVNLIHTHRQVYTHAIHNSYTATEPHKAPENKNYMRVVCKPGLCPQLTRKENDYKEAYENAGTDASLTAIITRL